MILPSTHTDAKFMEKCIFVNFACHLLLRLVSLYSASLDLSCFLFIVFCSIAFYAFPVHIPVIGYTDRKMFLTYATECVLFIEVMEYKYLSWVYVWIEKSVTRVTDRHFSIHTIHP